MVDIDIAISGSLQSAFDLPPCDAIRLPMPEPLQITLPSGGSIKALTDISKGIPNDCSMSFNLLLQLQPLLVALECPMRMLKLLKPIADIVGALASTPPKPPPASAVTDLADAVLKITPCFLSLAGIPAFVLDILRLLRAILNCLLHQMRSVRDLMNGLSLRLAAAEGNDDLMEQLGCAQENAGRAMQNLTQAIDPIVAFVSLISPFVEIAGMDLDFQLVPPAAPPEDLAAFDEIIATLQTAVDAIDLIVGPADE
jgi:hypothetical protein